MRLHLLLLVVLCLTSYEYSLSLKQAPAPKYKSIVDNNPPESIASSSACDCTISQGSFSSPLPFLKTGESGIDFYSYGIPLGASANTGLELGETLLVMMHEDTITGNTSLIIILDQANDSSGGDVDMTINCLPDSASIAVADEPGEILGAPPTMTGDFIWGPCCTDGSVISGVGCGNTFTINPTINSGVNAFSLVYGTVANPTYLNMPDIQCPITINCGGSQTCCDDAFDISSTVTNPNCDDSYNGAIDLEIECATTPQIMWSNGATTEDISNLSAGEYFVTVTDINGCAIVESFLLNPLSSPPQPSISGPTEFCEGDIITLGLNSVYSTYNWSNGLISPTIPVNLPGNYAVTVSNSFGCTGSAEITVIEHPDVFVDEYVTYCQGSSYIHPPNGQSYTEGDYSILNPTGTAQGCDSTTILHVSENPIYFIDVYQTICFGESIVIGGVPYSTTGTYQINLLTQNTGCDSIIFLDLTVLEPTSIIQEPEDIGCSASSVFVNGGGSLNGDQFIWTASNGGLICGGQNTPLITACSPGTYCLEVTSFGFNPQTGQALACVNESCVTIEEDNNAPTLNTTVTNVSCGGSDDGIASVTVVDGGVAPFIYVWNTDPLQITQTAINLEAGTYQVTVTGANGCTSDASVIIEEPDPLTIELSGSITSCAEETDGTASVDVSGGNPGYDFSWNTIPSQTTQTAINLAAGMYIVTVTDANSCSVVDSVMVTDAENLSLIFEINNNSCHGDSLGSATVQASGGSGAYTYEWNSNPVQTSSTANGLTAGTYTVIVEDSNGCSISESINVDEPDPINLEASSIQASCGGNNDGSASVIASGGTGTYTYEWNTIPIQTTATAIGLVASNYIVVVTDNAGCTAEVNAIVSEPNGINVSIDIHHVLCHGEASGSASVSIDGGVEPYNYFWSDPENQTTSTASELSAGSYYVTIQDANNCQVVETVIIDESPILELTESSTPVACHGESTGTASVEVSGGAGPYTFSWNDANQQTTATAYDLAAGTYCVEVTDAYNCTADICISMDEASVLELSTLEEQVDCFGNNTGEASVEVNGGTAPYNYQWNDPASQDSSVATNLTSGVYLVDVTDANGCMESIAIEIEEPEELIINLNGTNPECNDSSDGEVSVIASGGTPGYLYSWDDPEAQQTAIASNLQSGTYTVIVEDLNGCTASESVTIIPPNELILSISHTNVLCTGDNTGTATVDVSGGNPPYTYLWDDLINQNTSTASGLPAGTVTVLVTDANECSASTSVTIVEPDEILSASGVSTDALCGQNNGTIDLTVFGGISPYEYAWNGLPTNVQDPTDLGPGTYTVIITDMNGCTVSTSVTVMSPDSPIAETAITEVSCQGNSDGIMDITVSGGVAPYEYEWNIVANNGNEDLVNTNAGNYSVTVTDAAGCTVVANGIISEPDALTLNVNATPTDCDANNGSLSAVLSGGTGPFSFDWNVDELDGLQSAANLAANTYTLTVTDFNGCTAISSTIVGTPDGPTTSIIGTPTSCHGAADGSIDLTISGGTAPFDILWNDPILNGFEDPQNISAGLYSVQIIDQNGCESSISVSISEPEPIEISFNSTAISCFGANDGTATANVTGGTGPFTYEWCNGQNNSTVTDCLPGYCSVTVTDANNCTQEAEVFIEEPTALIVDYTTIDVDCYGASTGVIHLEVIGGNSPYSFSWTEGLPAIENPDNLAAGNYNVLVIDANNCSQFIENIIVNSPDPLSASLSETPSDCGVNTGSISVDIEGGVAPYYYNWNEDIYDGLQNPENLAPGYYELTISDANGCSVTNTTEIITPGGPNLSIAGENISCHGNATGMINLIINGGSAPFDINWGQGALNGQTSLSNLSAGDYSVLVTDANNCMSTASISLMEPDAPLTLSAFSIDALCNQANGAIDLTISGGVSPFYIDWSGTVTDIEDPQNLLPGTYSVTVTDNNGCEAYLTQTVNTPTGLSAQTESFNTSCFGTNDGAVNLSVNGGTAPYSFIWDDPENQTVEDPQNLLAGSYNVIITDADGCSIIANTIVEEPNELVLSSTSGEASCDNANGSIDLTVSGGTEPYMYNWNGGLADVEDPQNVFSGWYEVIVSDANACTATNEVFVSEPDALILSAETFDVDCYGNTSGAIALSVSGGTGTYTFQWDDPLNQAIEDPLNLSAGTYTVLVTDGNNCTITQTFEIIEPEPLTIENLNPTDINCFGENNGTATIVANGGTAPYNYNWSDDNFDGQDAPANMSSGAYTVTVSDINNCSATITFTIQEPAPLSLSVNTTDALCFNSNEGAIGLNVTGGQTPYSFDWNNGTYTSQNLSELFAGNYSVIVTDANNCTATISTQINQPPLFEVTIDILSDYSGNDISCANANDGIAQAITTGGVAPFTYQWNNGMDDPTIESLSSGTYQLTVFDFNGCSATNTVLLNAPLLLESEVSVISPSCVGTTDGILQIEVTGGTEPYLYALQNGVYSSDNEFLGLSSGTYSMSIQDLNGCIEEIEVAINDPIELQVELGDDQVLQMGDSLQLVPVLNIFNNELDTFYWQPDILSTFAPWVNPTETTQYQITVISENGCIDEDMVQIRVEKDRNIYIPNAFSPNDDGVNDKFIIYGGLGVEEVESFMIFNRWGELLFEAFHFQPNDPAFGWNGFFKDEKLNPGVFVYLAKVKFVDGRTRIYKGDISLMD